MPTKRPPLGSLWAYAYLIVPPQSREQLTALRQVTAEEHQAAVAEDRIWTGRLVLERRLTYLLIVSDRPEQDLNANIRVVTALNELRSEFVLTTPMPISGFPPGITGPDQARRNGR